MCTFNNFVNTKVISNMSNAVKHTRIICIANRLLVNPMYELFFTSLKAISYPLSFPLLL